MNDYRVTIVQHNAKLCEQMVPAENAIEAVENGFKAGILFVNPGDFVALVETENGFGFKFDMGG